MLVNAYPTKCNGQWLSYVYTYVCIYARIRTSHNSSATRPCAFMRTCVSANILSFAFKNTGQQKETLSRDGLTRVHIFATTYLPEIRVPVKLSKRRDN